MRSPVLKLKLLGRFHYIVAGLFTVLSVLPAFGLWHLWKSLSSGQDADFLPPWLGPTMATIGIGLWVDGWIMALLIFLAGASIRKRKRRTFSMVVGALAIPHFPIGSVLGAFSVSILMRPDVEALFYPREPTET